MSTVNWLYCYACLFDRTLVPLKYSFEMSLLYCPVCNKWLTDEYLYLLLTENSHVS